MIINMKAFQALPADIQKILQDQSRFAAYTTSQAWGNQNQYALEVAQRGGTKLYPWSTADSDKAVQIAKTAIWPKLAAASPECKTLMDIIMKQRAAWGRPVL
jgi:TRAP-type mannitol/chloroaromatic compound transport system substrate-binding protein